MHAGARVYRDLVGIAHQRIAAMADEVHLLVAGLPIRLKGPDRVTGENATPEAAADQDALDRVLDGDRAARCDRDGEGGRPTGPPDQAAGESRPARDRRDRARRDHGSRRSSVEQGVVVVAAGDHGVTRLGVSAYPSDVTAQMVANFVAGGAAINVLGAWAGLRVVVVDAGVASPIPTLGADPVVADGWSRRGSATGPRT